MLKIGEITELPLTSPMAVSAIQEAVDIDDCKKILKVVSELAVERYDCHGYGTFSSTHLPYTDDTAWIYGRLYDTALEVNKKMYGFENLDMTERVWYYEYQTEDYLDWHTELAEGAPFSGRKMAIMLNLSHSDEYRGGTTFFNTGEVFPASRAMGDLNIYPGYVLNSIEKIKSGTKKVLIAWFGGNNLK